MSIYHIQLDADGGKTLKEGVNSAVVIADSAADAKQIMKAYLGLPADGAWAGGTVTEITEAVDLENWRAQITIKDTSGDLVERVTVTGGSGADFDAIAALLVTALNATDSIAGAAYSTPNLTIAETTDNLGDCTVEVALLPPTTWNDPSIGLASLFGTITHEGNQADALAVVMLDIVLPEVKYVLSTK